MMPINILGAFDLERAGWLTGPILSKELRVASRHRRNYVLRVAYLLLFTLILGLVWVGSSYGRTSSAVYGQASMSRTGMSIAAFTVWFQFIIAQFAAVVLMSTSISDEIYSRTLGVLMTTPITSLQIVSGKLASRLYQLLLLICLSLPVLAFIRVFGGIPWGYLLSSLAVTLSAILFAACTSLFFSIFCRRAYVVMILSILTLLFLYAFVPLIISMAVSVLSLHHSGLNELEEWLWTAGNPWGALGMQTSLLYMPNSGRAAGSPFYLSCLTALCGSTVLVLLSAALVRKVALRQIAGGPPVEARSKARSKRSSDERIARVVGQPVIWKEFRSPLFRRRRKWLIIPAGMGLLLLGLTYFFAFVEGGLDNQDTQITYMVLYGLSAMLFAVSIPAGMITSEKESRSWLLLLTTTLSDWQILTGKALGALRRVLPCFGLFAMHMLFFTLIGYNNPLMLVLVPIPIVGIVLFMTGTGLYFSSLFKRTTTAVVANMVFAVAIWYVFPILILLATAFSRMSGYRSIEWIYSLNPFVNCMVVMAATAGQPHRSMMEITYHVPGIGSVGALAGTAWSVVLAAGYCFCGFIFAWRAKCRFRRNIS